MKLPVKEAYEAYRSRDTSYDGVLFLESNQRASTAGPFVRPDGPVQKTVIFLKARPRRKQQAIGPASSATRNGLPFQQAF